MSDIQDTSFLSQVYKLLKVLFVSRDEDCFLVQVKRLDLRKGDSKASACVLRILRKTRVS